MPIPVSERSILDALHKVPEERWVDVLRFIELIEEPPSNSEEPPLRTLGDILGSGMVGLWADRDDIVDHVAFARRLRHEASDRHRRGEPDAL